jgi:hypothetical protein
MKVQIQINNNMFELDAANDKDLFKQKAHLYEVFGEKNCGACGSDDLKPIVRTVKYQDQKTKKEKTAEYYELMCNNCRAKLSYGVHESGETLFPKRKLENGKFDYKNKGWHKWTGNKVEQEENKGEDVEEIPF